MQAPFLNARPSNGYGLGTAPTYNAINSQMANPYGQAAMLPPAQRPQFAPQMQQFAPQMQQFAPQMQQLQQMTPGQRQLMQQQMMQRQQQLQQLQQQPRPAGGSNPYAQQLQQLPQQQQQGLYDALMRMNLNRSPLQGSAAQFAQQLNPTRRVA